MGFACSRAGLLTGGAFVGMIAFAVPLGGCPDETSACSDYSPPASFDAQNPKVSFAKDVMPLFAQSCAFTSCHGSSAGSANGVFLGGTDPSKVREAIVDVRSTELPAMSYVQPGAPRESFLMRKMDGSQCVLNAQCTDKDCGQSMPRGEVALPIDQRDTVRRWIAQGAKND
jgi:hypothetical protein